MATAEKLPQLFVFERGGVELTEDLFSGISDIYKSNRDLLCEIRIKAPPPIVPLLDYLLLKNTQDLEKISCAWQRFVNINRCF